MIIMEGLSQIEAALVSNSLIKLTMGAHAFK